MALTQKQFMANTRAQIHLEAKTETDRLKLRIEEVQRGGNTALQDQIRHQEEREEQMLKRLQDN